MKLAILSHIFLLLLSSTVIESNEVDDVNLDSSLITAPDNYIINTLETSIDTKQFGTFLLHLPSSMTYTYTSCTDKVGTTFNTSMSNKINITTATISTLLETNKSSSITTNPYKTRTTLFKSSDFKYSTYYTPKDGNFNTKTSIGFANSGKTPTYKEILFSILCMVFLMF